MKERCKVNRDKLVITHKESATSRDYRESAGKDQGTDLRD